ncbi:hypothetical protein MASR1M32_24370 [Rhodobacter sp.]
MILGGNGFGRIHGGPGNDRITVGNRSSTVHTGPGVNTVTAAPARHSFHIGPGENTVTGGGAGASYHIAYGGVCRITDWHPGEKLVLEGWPGPARISVEAGETLLTLGLSVVILEGVTDPAAVTAMLEQVPAPV